MIKPLFPTALVLLALFSPATVGADERQTRIDSRGAENAGILSGIAVGASIGGPPGAMFGAAIGGLLGNGMAARHQVDGLQLDLATLEDRNAALEQQKLELELALQEVARDRAELMNVSRVPVESIPATDCCHNTIVSVYFRTGSDAVETHDHEIISSFARLSEYMSDPLIEITGYADRNGDADANLELSQRRSTEVRNLLASHGVNNATITTIAYGETRPLRVEPTFETDFFDRRVIMRLKDRGQLMFGSSPTVSQ